MNISEEDIVIDVFEGSGLLDLASLHENKIHKVLVRLGCYNKVGIFGNRKDKLFDPQWSLLASDPYFEKGVYIPYNPWRTWQYNLQWALDNIPSDCTFVEWDIENSWLPYSGKSYAANLAECLKRMPEVFNIVIYTGEGYLHLLEWTEKGVTVSGWPKNMDYSWAQYPYRFYPRNGEKWTWEKFIEMLVGYSGPSNKSHCPGKLILHQITGDKLTLPGSDKGLDVYVSQIPPEELDSKFISDSVVPDPLPVETLPAIPGPFILLSHREAGEGWFWPDGKLNAYPAAIATKGGTGSVTLKYLWLKSLYLMMTLAQWIRTWVDQEGWHNFGDKPKNTKLAPVKDDTGTVKQVEFAHNLKWVTGINAEGWYEYDVYYASDTPPNLSSPVDPYRRGIMTVDYKDGHSDTGGVINSDLNLPYISIARDHAEHLSIDPKYMKSLQSVPFQTTTKTPNSRLMVRSTPGATDPETILTRLDNNTPVTIFAFKKVGNTIWGRITSPDSLPGWIHMGFTNWKV